MRELIVELRNIPNSDTFLATFITWGKSSHHPRLALSYETMEINFGNYIYRNWILNVDFPGSFSPYISL